ncbi:unnamed protein product [Symbiodinium sp. CCMP2592]|nr:unnamed protein product [Symbiodinium sp. CCMP2592]
MDFCVSSSQEVFELKHVIRMSPGLCDELWSWVIVSPVCVANLMAQVLESLYATDASDHLLAAAAAPLPCEGRYNQHINVKELKAYLALERDGARLHVSVRLLALLDSQVALAALLKGHSSSPALNTLLRRSLPYMLGSDLYSGLSFAKSEENVADDPTRHRACREPVEELPPWFGALAAGNSEPLDFWLSRQADLASAREAEPFRPEDLVRDFPAPAQHGPSLEEPVAALADRPQEPRQAPSEVGHASGRATRARRTRLLEQAKVRQVAVKVTVPPGLDLGPKAGLLFLSSLPRHCFLPRTGRLNLSEAGALDIAIGEPSIGRALQKLGAPWVLVLGVSHLPQGVFEEVTLDNRFSAWIGAAVASLRPEIAFYVVAPDSSFVWRAPALSEFADPAGTQLCRVDLCRYGSPWQKRSRIASNGAIAGLRLFCKCDVMHRRLRGRVALAASVRVGWLQPEPLAVARVSKVAGLPLNAAIARIGSARPGEALNPGPRKPRVLSRTTGLESRPLLGQQTLGLGEQGWSSFLSWSRSRLSVDPLDLFSRSAALLAMALRAYGNWLYSSGGSLYSLRHTLLASQRKYLDLRPYSRIVWELVTRWEHVEPPQHRTPVPEPILKAIVSLTWMLGFRSFAGAALLAFYGLGRIGEVLQCTRGDLLLPSDDLWNQSGAVFLRLGASKTSTRGRPRVQHLKIIDETAIALISIAFGGLARSQPLFAQTPAAFRYRWNKALRSLNLDAGLRLTPGGLRGGGAVEAYRRGLPVTEIQWRMRLKNLHTLEFYLQELGAVSALAALNRQRLPECKPLPPAFLLCLRARYNSRSPRSLFPYKPAA